METACINWNKLSFLCGEMLNVPVCAVCAYCIFSLLPMWMHVRHTVVHLLTCKRVKFSFHWIAISACVIVPMCTAHCTYRIPSAINEIKCNTLWMGKFLRYARATKSIVNVLYPQDDSLVSQWFSADRSWVTCLNSIHKCCHRPSYWIPSRNS